MTAIPITAALTVDCTGRNFRQVDRSHYPDGLGLKELVRVVQERWNLSTAALARCLGGDAPTVERWASGQAEPSPDQPAALVVLLSGVNGQPSTAEDPAVPATLMGPNWREEFGHRRAMDSLESAIDALLSGMGPRSLQSGFPDDG